MVQGSLEVPSKPITLLTCGLIPGDRAMLETTFKNTGLKFIHTENVVEAMMHLRKLAAEVVLVERQLSDGIWEQLLQATPLSLTVVADRFADEKMWIQVLNADGHDLVRSQPFDRANVGHAVVHAWYHWLQAKL